MNEEPKTIECKPRESARIVRPLLESLVPCVFFVGLALWLHFSQHDLFGAIVVNVAAVVFVATAIGRLYIVRTRRSQRPRLVIDQTHATVVFEWLFRARPNRFWTLQYLRRIVKYECSFSQILGCYKVPRGRHADKEDACIVTDTGKAVIRDDWHGYEEAKRVLKDVARTTPDPPLSENPHWLYGIAIAGSILGILIFFLFKVLMDP